MPFFRFGPIDNAIVHRRWLIDITMLSRHCDSAAFQYHIQKENDGTPKGNKYEMGGKYRRGDHVQLLLLAKACNGFCMRTICFDFTFEHLQQGGGRMERDAPLDVSPEKM